MKEQTIQALKNIGLELPTLESRALKHTLGNITLIEVKDPDVPIYVDLGAADFGVVGKDWILERNRDVFEPLDLGFGAVRLSLIRPVGTTARIERIATKYPRLTRKLLNEHAPEIANADIVPLSGKIELASITGLSDAVIDLVETGNTIRANGLEETLVLLHSSARFIVNRASLKLKRDTIRPIIARLGENT